MGICSKKGTGFVYDARRHGRNETGKGMPEDTEEDGGAEIISRAAKSFLRCMPFQREITFVPNKVPKSAMDRAAEEGMFIFSPILVHLIKRKTL